MSDPRKPAENAAKASSDSTSHAKDAHAPEGDQAFDGDYDAEAEQGYDAESDHDPEQDYEAEGDHDPEQGYDAEGDHAPEQDYDAEGDHDPEQDYVAEGDHDPEQDYVAEGDHDPEQDYVAEDEGEGLSHPLAQDLMLNPSKWRIWPAIAVMRWLLRKMKHGTQQIVYRSNPTLHFCPSEIHDVAIDPDGMELILNAPGIAAPGSPLPTVDIDRIIRDSRRGGALAAWLDGPGDRFMQALELSRARNNAAFALATGGYIEVLRVISNLIGRSAPLSATKGGVLQYSFRHPPEGATGLAGLFVGAANTAGLIDLFKAFVGLPVQVKEFTGAEVLILRPARVGRPLGLILGSKCKPASAGIDIIIDGGKDSGAQKWARDPKRRQSLHLLATSYIGSPSPEARIFLQLDRSNVSPSVLNGDAVIGGLAVMGPPKDTINIPIYA